MNRRKKSESDHVRFARESTLTTIVRNYLTSQRDIAFYKASDRYHKGISDIICCINGRFVAIELKADEGAPSAHQLLFLKNIREVGGIGAVCYTLADVKKLVEEARGETVG